MCAWIAITLVNKRGWKEKKKLRRLLERRRKRRKKLPKQRSSFGKYVVDKIRATRRSERGLRGIKVYR